MAGPGGCWGLGSPPVQCVIGPRRATMAGTHRYRVAPILPLLCFSPARTVNRGRASSGVEIHRLGMMDDDRRGGLLRVKLVFLGQFDPDPPRIQQLEDLGLLLQVRASGVPERVSRPPVAQVEERLHLLGVLVGDAQLLADALVPVLGERLGHLDGDAVQLQVLAVAVGVEQLGGRVRGRSAHGDHVEHYDIHVAGGDRPEVVGAAQPAAPALGRSCHWPRNSADSFRKAAMSRTGMPLTIRESPRNGAVGSGTSTRTSERATSLVLGAAGAGPRARVVTTRGALGASRPGRTPSWRSWRSWSMTRRPAKASRQ